MKKKLCIFLGLFTILLAGCTTSNNQVTQIDSQEGEQLFNNQLDDFQYIKDLEDYLSYNILSITEDKPYSSDFSFSTKFDKNSSIQGGIDFSQKKFTKSHDLETSDITFNIQTQSSESNTEPFDASGSVSLLYQDDEVYAKLHNLGVFMGEGNMTAKMYTLLGDLLVDNRVNLEIHSGGIISIDENENKKLPYIMGTIKNILKTENIQDSPNFLGSVVELLDTINSYIDLGISTNELTLVDSEISYFELGDKSIQKQFTGSFQGKDSIFNLSFTASKNGVDINIYSIKEYDEDIQNYKDVDLEFLFSIQCNKKSEYSITFTSTKAQQKIVDLEGNIKYSDKIKFSANYTLEPLEIVAGQKISGKLDGTMIKESGESENNISELTGNIVTLSEILSSL